MDGAKARKTLFDYLQHRHPGVETLWHSLVQMYNTYDAKNFPQYSTKPMSTPSLILWESFYRHIREDMPLEYPQSRPLVLKRKDNLSKSQGTVEEGEKKRSKRKRKSKSKGDRDVEPVQDPACQSTTRLRLNQYLGSSWYLISNLLQPLSRYFRLCLPYNSRLRRASGSHRRRTGKV